MDAEFLKKIEERFDVAMTDGTFERAIQEQYAKTQKLIEWFESDEFNAGIEAIKNYNKFIDDEDLSYNDNIDELSYDLYIKIHNCIFETLHNCIISPNNVDFHTNIIYYKGLAFYQIYGQGTARQVKPMSDDMLTFKDKLKYVDNGKYAHILDQLEICDTCKICTAITHPESDVPQICGNHRYGKCIGLTLSPNFLRLIIKKYAELSCF